MKRTIWNDAMTLETLDMRRAELMIKLEQDIVIIADLGLWNGRKMGYKVVYRPWLNDILVDNSDWSDWYVDSHNVRCDATHHDGINHYLYRIFKEGLSEEQKQNFLNKIYFGKVTSKDITRYTKSLRPMVMKELGW